ncbi:MAG: TetR/AcrR family transcriptional regulator [Ilumatobacter sp.]
MTDTLPKRMTRDARRLALLDAATAVLLADDRPAFTFETIAAQAGVSATLPYKYFESVDDVADQLYHRVVDEVDEATDRLLADPSRSFDDKVRSTLESWCDTIRQDGPLLLRLNEGVAHASLARAIDRRRERAIGVWATVLAAEFELDADDARVVAASITAGSSATLQRWTRDGLDRGRAIELFVRLARAQAEAAAHHSTR